MLKEEPDYSALPADTPPLTRRLLRRCLEKDRRERLRHIGDARADLRDSLELRDSASSSTSRAASAAESAERQRNTAQRRAHATGTSASRVLTLVFTDLVESTGLKTRLGDHAAAAVIARHHDLVRSLLAGARRPRGRQRRRRLLPHVRDSQRGGGFALRAPGGPPRRRRAAARFASASTSARSPSGRRRRDPASRSWSKASPSISRPASSRSPSPGQVLLSRAAFDAARQRLARDEARGRDRVARPWALPLQGSGTTPSRSARSGIAGRLAARGAARLRQGAPRGRRRRRVDSRLAPGDRPRSFPAATTGVWSSSSAPARSARCGWRPTTRPTRGGSSSSASRRRACAGSSAKSFCCASCASGSASAATSRRSSTGSSSTRPSSSRPPTPRPAICCEWAKRKGGIAAVPLADRIEIAAQAAEALAAAHDAGILHKDLKPSNLLISEARPGRRPAGLPHRLRHRPGDLARGAVVGGRHRRRHDRDPALELVLDHRRGHPPLHGARGDRGPARHRALRRLRSRRRPLSDGDRRLQPRARAGLGARRRGRGAARGHRGLRRRRRHASSRERARARDAAARSRAAPGRAARARARAGRGGDVGEAASRPLVASAATLLLVVVGGFLPAPAARASRRARARRAGALGARGGVAGDRAADSGGRFRRRVRAGRESRGAHPHRSGPRRAVAPRSP